MFIPNPFSIVIPTFRGEGGLTKILYNPTKKLTLKNGDIESKVCRLQYNPSGSHNATDHSVQCLKVMSN